MKLLWTVITALLLSSNLYALKLKEAYFAGGCFWGVEYYLEAQKGVDSVESGFMGGFTTNPSYKEVVQTKTGHIETVKVVYDSDLISFESLAKIFFEIHDFTQVGRQGPDIGERYESYVFYQDSQEKQSAEKLIRILTSKDYEVL